MYSVNYIYESTIEHDQDLTLHAPNKQMVPVVVQSYSYDRVIWFDIEPN